MVGYEFLLGVVIEGVDMESMSPVEQLTCKLTIESVASVVRPKFCKAFRSGSSGLAYVDCRPFIVHNIYTRLCDACRFTV